MEEAHEVLDVRKKACPMPVLLTKRKLAELEVGKILKVIGDYPSAKENIQRFVLREGHEILNIKENRAKFEIVIKKA
ncbi:sulfurtransferase TusA family protein [Candidatus Hecatella orcuttiae]|jgi:tRNA 2-thiouridine synthesizing protein A|uniref:sulfurtransferase TusA family protein n=1 Tax=Candidatus Hecatella orcuttiae TaxID=1935119 RepID=UPI002867FD5D|nr:sulfurtransferase TusA family protein [Candidatus Hecatella orcuttiae]